MDSHRAYLLDTNIVLHWTREGSPVAEEIERQFKLSSSPFRPLICEVTLGEMLAFARGRSWGKARMEQWANIEERLTVVPIGRRTIFEKYADIHSDARTRGLPIQHDHNDMWIAATSQAIGTQLLSTDAKAFLPLRDTYDVVVLDAHTGTILA